MAHWFHRNPLKATAKQDFQVKMVAQDVEALKICSDLKQARMRLVGLLPDPHHTSDQIQTALKLYLSVLRGFLEAPTGESSGASKLRHAVRFRWSHSMLGTNAPEVAHDAVFDAANLIMNVAFWYMKHSCMIAAKDDLEVEEAKDVHQSLRKASGLIKFVQDTLIPQLLEKTKSGSDLDMRVLSAYLNQCTAEAQEVTIARAVALKHNPSLISQLANETSKLFLVASDSITGLDPMIFGRWKSYFQLKSQFYLAQAYNYAGENLLSQDKCGEAIRALQESKKCYTDAENAARTYAKSKGPGVKAKPEQHAFFRRFSPIVQRTLDKCERENGFIYHHKVPYDPPNLDMNDKTFGLVSPEQFELPPISPLWTAPAYAAFDISQSADDVKKNKSKTAEKVEGELKPVEEVKIKSSEKDPKHESGCVIS